MPGNFLSIVEVKKPHEVAELSAQKAGFYRQCHHLSICLETSETSRLLLDSVTRGVAPASKLKKDEFSHCWEIWSCPMAIDIVHSSLNIFYLGKKCIFNAIFMDKL